MRNRGRTGTIERILIFICLIVMSVVFLNYRVSADEIKKRAIITITNTVHDFGRIDQGEKTEATFVLRNTGDEALLIYEVRSDDKKIAKNIATAVSKNLLLPGEEGNIKVTLDSTGLYGNLMSGIVVMTNDEEKPKVFLNILARVRPIIAFNPPFIWCDQITKEGSFSGKAKIVGKIVDEGKVDTLSIQKSSPSIRATVEQRSAKDGSPVLEFVLLPDLKAGTFKESIALVSENPPARAELPLYGQKLGDIRVTPDRLDFFPQKGMEPDSRTILLECDKPFTITKVEDLSGLLDISIKTIAAGRKYELSARLKNPMAKTFLGVVQVHTDLKENPLIDVPIIGGEIPIKRDSIP